MIEQSPFTAAQKVAGARPLPAPPRGLYEDAGSPFTFHGHRLSSLYRGASVQHIPFIFLKILPAQRLWQVLHLSICGKMKGEGSAS